MFLMVRIIFEFLKSYKKFYLVFMRRVCGPEKYYLFDNAKSLRENLEGKGIVRINFLDLREVRLPGDQ